MKKKTKKLVLSKETVRSLTDDLKLAVGATATLVTCEARGCTMNSLGYTCAMHECDAHVTGGYSCSE